MNGSDLLNAVSNAEESYLSEAENISAVAGEFRKEKKKKIKTVACILGCFVIAASAVFVLRGLNDTPALPENVSGESSPAVTPSAAGQSDPTATAPTEQIQTVPAIGEPATVPDLLPAGSPETAFVPQWDERSELDRFTELTYNGVQYVVSGQTDASFFGEALGTAQTIGFDMYTDTQYKEEVSVFTIRDVLPACALGVRFADGVTAAYVNFDYTPASLGQFLNDAGLKTHLTFGKGYADYFDDENKYHSVEFDDFDDAAVWEMLLSETGTENNAAYEGFSHRLCDIAVDIPALGIVNKALWVTEDGYLCTNILETGKFFFIGAEKTEAFAEYLYENVHHSDTVPFAASEEPVTGSASPAGSSGEEVVETVVCTTAPAEE